MECKACGAANPDGARFCLNCGEEFAALCGRCAARLPSGARYCPACGRPVEGGARTVEPVPEAGCGVGPERKLVTVLFADFAGFTAFVDRTDAEEVRDYMSAVWARLDETIRAHGGSVEQHMGDGMMALFGDRQAREDAPAQAVRAGLAIQASLKELKWSGAQAPLELRIGIHTGLVILESKSAGGDCRAVGDAINVASRLEQLAPKGGVLISNDTFRGVFGLFDMQPLPPLVVKGKPEPIQTYQVLRPKSRAVARQMRGVEGVATPMVGRQQELERLRTIFQSVLADGETRVVTVLGEAGIGKSRLLREFQQWAEMVPEHFWLFSGQATADMPSLPFALMRDVLATRFEIQESDSAAVAREKLESGLVELVNRCADATAWSEQEPQVMAHFIGHLLRLDFSHSPHLRQLLSDPEQIRQRGAQYLGQFFTTVSRGGASGAEGPRVRGALLVAEDIHWSDEASLDLIDQLARTSEGVPLMILCLARPSLLERRPAWGEGVPAHQRLHLDCLSRGESRALVETILRKAAGIPQALRELIVGGGEGNPFYIEEIVKMLIDQKVIVPEEESWKIVPERLARARVPPTLTGVLQARLDELTLPERAVLQRASVVGRVFWDRALEGPETAAERAEAKAPVEVFSDRQPEILEALSGLRRKELIFQRENSSFSGTTEYVFKHELLRQAAYESLLKKQRRDYHARTAAWLIRQSSERITEAAGLVATHFEQAGQPAEAAGWYGKAGQQARAGYEPAMAIDYFRKALALLAGELPGERAIQMERSDWLEGLAESLGAQARFAEAIEVCLQMQRLAEALGDVPARTRAWNALAFLHERRGDHRASIEAASEAERLARQAGESGRRERIRALHLKGWGLYRRAELDEVLALADETLELCAQTGDRHGLATSLKLHGAVYLQRGDYPQAERYFEQGLALYRELGDRRNTAAMWSNLGEGARLRGDFRMAVEFYEKALSIARQIGHRESELIYLSNLGGARCGLGQYAQAEAELRQLMLMASADKSGVLSEAFSFLAEACLEQGKLPAAREAAQQALALARESENDLDLGVAWRGLGRLAARQRAEPGDASAGSAAGLPGADPNECFAESLRLFQRVNAEGEQARTLRAWAEFDFHQGQTEAGHKKVAMAKEIFLRLGMTAELKRTGLGPGPGEAPQQK